MNEEHLLLILKYGWAIRLGLLFGDPPLGDGTAPGSGRRWGLCRSRSPALYSPYTRSSSITGVPWL